MPALRLPGPESGWFLRAKHYGRDQRRTVGRRIIPSDDRRSETHEELGRNHEAGLAHRVRVVPARVGAVTDADALRVDPHLARVERIPVEAHGSLDRGRERTVDQRRPYEELQAADD